jgi:two-component system cell cycle response regulator CtrA
MRILLVEPDADVRYAFEQWCRVEKLVVYTTDNGEEAIDLGKLYDFDAIVLELNLADMSGYEVLRTLRVAKVQTPVIVCSGLSGVEDIVRALGFGADAYLTKPAHKDLLVANIHAVVRRSRGIPTNTVTIGNLVIDIGTKRAQVAGDPMHLTAKEYAVLELLALRQGLIVTKEMFLNHLYGGMDEPELKIIDVFICKLRHKLRQHGADELVQTVWGRGYTLAEEHKSHATPVTTKPSELNSQERAA